MAGLQARLDTAFGGLGDLSPDNPPWMPSLQTVFRSGPEVDHLEADQDGEYREQLRREVVSGMAMDLADEDRPGEDGVMASKNFCRQLDEEEEFDGVDTTAALFSNEYRPAPGTEVLEHNIYDQRIAYSSLEGRIPMEEEEEEEDRNNNDQQLSHPQKPRLITLSSRGPSKSNLRTPSSRQTTMKKRVSFTGVPEPPVPWVPPHKRGNYISKFQQGTLPPSPSGSPPKIFGRASGIAVSTRNNNNIVPDHVVNPQNYTRYEFDEPILVGGGIAQLTPAEKEQRVASTHHPMEDHVDEVEEERWQGAVGAGIEFRRRAVATGKSDGDHGSKETLERQQQLLPPSVVKATFNDDEQDQELEDAVPIAISGTRIKKQYRRTEPASRLENAYAMIE
jgi:hypothetical protein